MQNKQPASYFDSGYLVSFPLKPEVIVPLLRIVKEVKGKTVGGGGEKRAEKKKGSKSK
jgi:hypothetical protein